MSKWEMQFATLINDFKWCHDFKWLYDVQNKREMCITAARADDKVTTSDLNPLFYHLDFHKRHYLRSLNAINILHDITQSEDIQVQNGLTRMIIFPQLAVDASS